MSDCNKCCNFNSNEKSSINNNLKKCNQITHTNYTFWLEQNKHYQKYLYLNKKTMKCNAEMKKENSNNTPIKRYIYPDVFFTSHEDYINYQRAQEIMKGNPNKKNPNKKATPFIGNAYFR